MSTDPIFAANGPYDYFYCDRDPSNDEPVVAAANLPDNTFYFWWNTQTTRVFLPKIRAPEQMTWAKILTTDDLVPPTELLPREWEQTPETENKEETIIDKKSKKSKRK